MFNKIGNLIGFNPTPMTSTKRQVAQYYRADVQNQANRLLEDMQDQVAVNAQRTMPKIDVKTGHRIARNADEARELRLKKLRGPGITESEFKRRFNNLKPKVAPKATPAKLNRKVAVNPFAQLNMLDRKLKNLPKIG